MFFGNIFNRFRQPKEVPVRDIDTAAAGDDQSTAVAIALAIGVLLFVRK